MHALLQRNLAAVRARIDQASASAGRSNPPRLLAVTKSVSPSTAAALVELGQRDLGENRLPGLEAVHAAMTDSDVRLHFIGHLQRNKARRVVRLAHAIHAVDSLSLIDALERIAAEEQRRPRIYLQLKLVNEPSKHGLAPAELDAAIERAGNAKHLDLAGLMVIAPLIDDPVDARRAAAEVFEQTAALAAKRADAPWCDGRALLSMGMSGDLEQAVSAGSDWLRVGTALFEGLPAEARR